MLGVAIALAGLTGFTFRTRIAPDLQAEGCGVNDGKLCQQICMLPGCGGCCDWRFYYYTKVLQT